MRIRLLTILVALSLAAPAGLAASDLRPSPVSGLGEAGPEWKGYQTVEADRAGRVFYFRGESYQVYPVDPRTGNLGKPLKLETSLSSSSSPREAAMSTGGDRWLMIHAGKLRYFEKGKEKALPVLPWGAQSVGFHRDSPVVAVLPIVLKGTESPSGDLPWLFTLSGDRWDVLRELEGVTEQDANEGLDNGNFEKQLAQVATRLTTDSQGRLWAAHQYSYKIQRLSPSGRVLEEIRLDDGRFREKKQRASAIEIKRSDPSQNPTSATSDPVKEKKTYTPFPFDAVLYDVVGGRDGRIYTLTRTDSGGLALDRYDPVESVLERKALSVKWKGNASLAAGKDALYLAPYEASAGRWKLSWEELERPGWKQLELESRAENDR